MKRIDIRAALRGPAQREGLLDALTRSIQAVPKDGTNPTPPQATTIIRILNFGTAWTVKLSCGCARKGLTDTDLKREQFYIGKAVWCDKHQPEDRT